MAKSTGNKVYAVAAGRVPGIYFSWGDCQAQVSGYKGAVFKSFHQRHEAESFFHLHASTADLRSSSATVISSKIVPRTSCIASDGNSRSPLGCGESEGVSHENKIFRGPGVSYVSKKVYAVASGRKPGVYASWPECQAQVSYKLLYFGAIECLFIIQVVLSTLCKRQKGSVVPSSKVLKQSMKPKISLNKTRQKDITVI
mmetsp:Transcript_14395/g.30859  ORF Transcript_14395/g.30859 Transcript_14395/m.30859 type:complete len:199 (+) Transcript_14395:46-642(+)